MIPGKFLIVITLAVVGIGLIPTVKKNGVVAMGWVLGFLGIATVVLILLAVMKPY